jgi:uncharacterized protein YlxW (UPF0749 family)
MLDAFTKVQAAIEAIERAIVHEEQIAANQPVTTPGLHIVIVSPDKG